MFENGCYMPIFSWRIWRRENHVGMEKGPPGSLEKANWCFISNEWHVSKKPTQLSPPNQTKRQFLYIKSKNALLVCSIGTVLSFPPPPLLFSHWFVFFFPFKYLYVLAYIFLYWHNKFHNIVKAQMHSSYSVLLVCSIGIIAIVPTVFFSLSL